MENKVCVLCGTKENLTKHHVIPKSLKDNHENLTITLCEECHRVPHATHHPSTFSPIGNKEQDECKNYFCRMLGIDRVKAEQAVNNKMKRKYLEGVKEQCRIALLKMLV